MPGNPRGLFASDIEVAAARWVQHKVGPIDHERRVLAAASRLSELTRPILKFGMAEQRLLRLAALLHDVGRSVNEKNHPAEGAEMIVSTTALDLSPFDRRALAFLTRYHRGAVPAAESAAYLRQGDPQEPVRKILGLLRVADALDSRQFASPQLAFSMVGRQLTVRCCVTGDLAAAREVYRRRKKYHLLESFLGSPIEVEVRRAVSSCPT